jgi:iron complex outermembrane receptor protein
VKTESDYSGYVNRLELYRLLNNGTFNPLGGNAPDVMALVSPRFSNESTSVLKFFEANAQREIGQLPGGPLNMAVGVNWKKKDLDAPSADLLARGIVGNGGAYVFGEETNSAVFAELEGDVIKDVLVNLAARYDHYDTYGNSFTPSAKFKWNITPTVSLRGTFARGFRAPNAAEVGTASSIFSSYTADDPILCANGNPQTAGNVPTACNLTPAFVQITNPDLQPEKSKSFTVGLIVEPIRNVSATLDWYSIDVKNQITSAATLPGFVPSFVRNPIAPVEISNGDGTTTSGLPSVGTIAYATTDYVNAGGTKTSGVELNLSARQRLGDYGNVRGELTFNHMISYELEAAGVTYQLAGTHGPSTVSGNTGNPKNRAQLTLGWERGPVGVTTTVNWVDKFSALDPSVASNDCASAANISGRNYFFGGDTPANYCTIRSFTTADLNVTYKLSNNWTLRGAILNLFDREPPIDVGTYSNANTQASYNGSLHQSGAVGRYFSVGASYAF